MAMKNPMSYESVEQKEEYRKIVEPKIKKMYEKYGFVVFEIMEEIKFNRVSRKERINHLRKNCRGGSSY